jgi:hypothetical protein
MIAILRLTCAWAGALDLALLPVRELHRLRSGNAGR